MKRILLLIAVGSTLCILGGNADGRGWGGGGGRSYSGGYSGGSRSYSGSASHSESGGYGHGYSSSSGSNSYGGSYSGSRSTSSSSSAYGRSASGSYDHSWSDAAGGSVNTSGSRSASQSYGGGSASSSRETTATGANGQSYSSNENRNASANRYTGTASSSGSRNVEGSNGGSASTSYNRNAAAGPNGGYAASGSRETTATGAGGQTYSANRSGAVAGGPMGRTVGTASGSVDGRNGSSSWNTAFAGNRYGDMSHYSSVSATTAHGTSYWSGSYMTSHATGIRTSFAYPNTFQPAWYTAHPGCWAAAGWAAGAAWSTPAYSTIGGYIGTDTAAPTDYAYGSNVFIYNDDVVNTDTNVAVPAPQYAEQAVAIADKGQTAPAPPTDDWKPLGIFSLTSGDETTSNNIFQLAVNAAGIIRGNYYDGMMDSNTEVYGSVDKATQRAAWSIGKNKDRVFEAGIFNLTMPQCTCLLHLGKDKTNQMMLVRMEKPAAKQ